MISAPDKELKAIQDTINHRVLSFVNIHPAATGFRCKMSISDNVRPHLGKPYVLKTDIHDFFGSIRSPRVRKMFEDMGYPPKIARVLAALCCVHRCLPQGASTSPALSNIISYEMDKNWRHWLLNIIWFIPATRMISPFQEMSFRRNRYCL